MHPPRRKTLAAVPRHNVNLTGAELRWVLRGAVGAPDAPGGRADFEAKSRRYFGAAHVIAVESGRTSLYLALHGLGIKPGDTVVLPSYCFYSLVNVVEGMGCKARFAPIDPDTFALDPARLSEHVDGADAVVVIHPFGQLADMAGLQAVCSTHGIPTVEDASQATGGRWGRHRAGVIGDVGVFSLVSGKNLQTFGGGLITTQRDDVARTIRARLRPETPIPTERVQSAFRSGLQRWFLTTPLGHQGLMHPATVTLDALAPAKLTALAAETRTAFDPDQTICVLSDVQGRLGCMELAELDRRNAIRRANALRLLDGLKGLHGLTLPTFDPSCENTFNAVAVRTPWARELAMKLRRRGYDTRPDYMEFFGSTRAFDDAVIYLPNHPGMCSDTIDRLAATVRDILRPT